MNTRKSLHWFLHNVLTTERRLRTTDFAQIGISPGQPKMLNYIFQNDGCMQKDIADATGIEPPSATSILAIMEREGLIRRVQCKNDKRRLNVYITEKGLEKKAQIEAIDRREEALLLEGFTPEEEDLLFAFLERLAQNAGRHHTSAE